MVHYGGMQLLPSYKKKLDKRFLLWYSKEFTNKRMGYGHWTAGWRDMNELVYHRVVVLTMENEVKVCENKDPRDDLYAHTFGRNRNSWAIALAGMRGASPRRLGSMVPSAGQCKAFVEETAKICVNLRQPVSHLMCHHEAADNIDQGPNPPYRTPGIRGKDGEPYGPMSDCLRWDIWVKVDPETLDWFTPYTEKSGLLWFADWWRGETILRIQELTRHVWSKDR